MQTPRLHLTRKGSLLCFRWISHPSQQAMEFRKELREQGERELQSLLSHANDIVLMREKARGTSLEDVGRVLYQLLLPEELRSLLSRNEQPLALISDDLLFPWEILHDGHHFLGLQFPLGRLPERESSFLRGQALHKGWTTEQLHIIAVSNFQRDLPEADREVEFFTDSLPIRQTRHLLSGADVSPARLRALAPPPNYATLLHVTGRADFSSPDAPSLLLDKEELSLTGLCQTFPSPLLLFVHLTQASGEAEPSSAQLLSWLPSFLNENVRGAVVSTRPTFTQAGRQLIGEYYRCLFHGTSPAEALTRARQRFLERNPHDPSWSSFLFFGDPSLFLVQQTEARRGLPLRSLEPAAAPTGSSSSEASLISPAKRDGHASRDGQESPLASESALEYDFDLEQAIGIALMEAKNLRQDFIGTPHLFIGLTKCPGGVTRALLESSNFDPKKVRDTIRYALGFGHAAIDAKILPTQRCARALKAAELNSRKENDHLVREKHLLASILQSGEGLAFEVLKKMGADPQKLYEKLMRGEIPQSRIRHGGDTPTIDRYGRDLTSLAEQGSLPALTGRAEELMRLAQILLRRFKNNPLIIGEAGVGKTALVEGLAQRIVAGAVPEDLRGRRLVELSLSSLVAGTRYRGDFEERLTLVIREAREHPEIILFLDEFHTVVGAGETHQGTLDAANILKPALARGEIRCIGATTPIEYRKHIEKDAALERRFHPLFLEEPSVEEMGGIMAGARRGYEEHHRVRISEDVLKLSIDLAVRYLPDRRLPDKALDLIDEACALVTLRGYASSHLTSDGKLRSPDLLPLVTPPSIYKVLSDWTGIPVGEISKEEGQRLLELPERLGKKVIGQPQAIDAVCHAIQAGRAGLKRPGRPTAVMLFLGPSGVGKTALCRTLAKELFGQESSLIRLDMSEYAEKHSTARLVGAPPGYVGFGEENQTISQLHHRPYSVVLLDEIEKAHPEVLDLFLQLFEEGRLSDAFGRTIDGRHAVFIMTSNLLAERFQRRKSVGFQTVDVPSIPKPELDNELRRAFRPEFLNRIDDAILFEPLSDASLLLIGRLAFEEIAERAREQNALLHAEEDALRVVVQRSVDPLMGARPLLRALEHLVTRPLSQMLLRTMSVSLQTPLHARLCLRDGEPLLVQQALPPSLPATTPISLKSISGEFEAVKP